VKEQVPDEKKQASEQSSKKEIKFKRVLMKKGRASKNKGGYA